jgi:hypothetical protein
VNTRTPQKSPRSATWVLVLAAVASLMAALDAMVVSTALTTVRAGVRDRDPGRRVRRGRQLRLSRGIQRRLRPSDPVSTALSLLGAIAGLGLPGRPQATVTARPQRAPAFGTA